MFMIMDFRVNFFYFQFIIPDFDVQRVEYFKNHHIFSLICPFFIVFKQLACSKCLVKSVFIFIELVIHREFIWDIGQVHFHLT